MNKMVSIAIVLLVLGGLFTVFWVVPAAAPSSTGMSVVCYNEKGEKVYEAASGPQPFSFGFTNKDGASIVTAAVYVSWTVSGIPDGTPLAFTTVETVESRIIGSDTSMETGNNNNQWTKDGPLTGNRLLKLWTVADIVYRLPDGDESGYELTFTCKLSATATIDGVSSTVSTDLSVMLEVHWVSATASFAITGSMYFG